MNVIVLCLNLKIAYQKIVMKKREMILRVTLVE